MGNRFFQWIILEMLLALLWGMQARLSPPALEVGTSWQLRVHPVGPWFVGDVLSWEVRPPRGLTQGRVQVQVNPPGGPQWERPIVHWGIDQVPAAVFPWVWATSDLLPGRYRVVVRYQGQVVLEEGVWLWPEERRPYWEQGVRLAWWQQGCCRVYYFTQTETQRDLPALMQATQWAYRQVRQALGPPPPNERAVVVFFPRMLGQGGFMSREMWVSYRDRGPMMEPVTQIVHHEMVHWFQRVLAPGWKPGMLVEGMAVYLSRGHYRWGEPLYRRAQAVWARGGYIPLELLSQDFYRYQHEMAYIQAGALVAYMVERWGWERFWAFYRGLQSPQEGETPPQALDRQLQEQLGISLQDLDEAFRAFLQEHPATPEDVTDLEFMLRLYEAFRRYQRLLDPDGYYGTAWLPRLEVLEQRGIVTDALRGPNSALHQTIELLFQQASWSWLAGDLTQGQVYLQEAEALLKAYEQGYTQPWQGLPLATQVRRWVAWVQACGGEIQRLYPRSPQPWAEVRTPWNRPILEVWWLPQGERSFSCPPGGVLERMGE